LIRRPLLLIAAFGTIVSGQCRSAHAQRVLGLDVSAWQGSIGQTTWNNIHSVEDRDFVFIRSSRGGTTGYYDQTNADNNPPTNTLSQRYDDPYFIQNITRATTAGMYAGSYHFSRPDVIASTLNANGIANTGTDEANHFMQMAGPWMRPGYLVPVHDFEAGDGARTDIEMTQFALDFSNRIYEVMGIRPAIYVNGNYAQNILGGGTSTQRSQLAQQSATPPSVISPAYPTLWSARWPNQADPNSIDVQNGNPTIGYANIYGPWDDYGVTHPWAFWQYASTGRLTSFNGGGSNLDFDVAHGDIEYLQDYLVPAVWMNNSNGDWSTLANWNSGQTPIAPVQGPGQVARVGPMTLPTPRLPGAAGSGVTAGLNDTVILERPAANITVTLSTGTHNIRKLYMRETLNITGGSLTVNYDPNYSTGAGFPNSLRSGPISAQFSGPVTLSGGSLNVHTLQVDATRTFTLGGGTLTLNKINLMPHSATPAKMLINGDVDVNPLAGAAAVIANGSGAGTSGRVDLDGAARRLNVGDGAAAVDLAINVPIVNGGLTKAGPGTLALNGANTYGGDTVVEAGTLSLANAALANGADLLLSTGALLDLKFAGSDTIDSFFIDGVSQAAGTWGAIGSAAQFTSPLIAGIGFLQVSHFVAPPLPCDFDENGTVDGADMAAWSAGFGMETGATHQQGDADSDGDVDGADFLVWQSQLGSAPAAAPAAAAVPEPASVWAATALYGSVILACRMRDGRRRAC
jgi:autotransporter-associated beta strand protein